ncbi:potassium channel family protein [Archaeoglobus neptunius]|uniref:potassium channel family protein n=1 Tax=Archaeoglobus neptunius TaxID=2798580 RepID=UPI001925A83F|nr:potassium channel family protein [Archaeoglobus neptunius]
MPRTVKDLLVDIKDTTELMVDLAYSAILYNNEDIAEEVLELESRVLDLLKQIRVVSVLAARRVEDAEKVSSILTIANAGQKISSAAGDISSLVLRGFKLSEEIVKLILYHSEETVVRVRVPEDSDITGKTLGELKLHTKTGMRIIAIKRGFSWIFNPDRDTIVYKEDLIFARGDPSAVPKFYEYVTGKPVPATPEPQDIQIEELDRAVDMVIEMKNLSELAIDLAYSSLIYGNDEIALEVVYLEEIIDNMKFEIQRNILLCSKYFDREQLKPLMSIIEIAYSSEQIADAARDISEILLDKMDVPAIFKAAMRETDEVLTLVTVSENSPLHGKTLGEARVESNTGMHVIAIKRKNDWITKPTANTKIFSGDLLIAKGTREGESELLKLCSTRAQLP